jgi:hypothetical protein
MRRSLSFSAEAGAIQYCEHIPLVIVPQAIVNARTCLFDGFADRHAHNIMPDDYDEPSSLRRQLCAENGAQPPAFEPGSDPTF